MRSPLRHSADARPLRTTPLRAALFLLLGAWLFCAGGCAMLPFAITTGASLAMPQAASLAMTGVKGVYTTASLASDERDVNTILRDNMLTLKAKSSLLTDRGADNVQVYAYNGEVFAVGVTPTEEDRERLIRRIQDVKGVGAVKGYIRVSDPELAINRKADINLESQARLALSRHLLHKNSGVEVQAVDGRLCIMGVVGTHAEALDLIQYVETMSGARALSLLSIREEYAQGRMQTNRLYLLESGEAEHAAGPRRSQLSLRDDGPGPLSAPPVQLAEADPAAAPIADPGVSASGPALRLAVTRLPAPRPAHVAPAQTYAVQAAKAAPAANKARAAIQQRLTGMAGAVDSPEARAELLAVAGQVASDRELSIADRLSVAAAQASQPQAKARLDALLALF